MYTVGWHLPASSIWAGALAARRGLRCPRRAALEAAAATEGWVARDLAALLERAELVRPKPKPKPKPKPQPKPKPKP